MRSTFERRLQGLIDGLPADLPDRDYWQQKLAELLALAVDVRTKREAKRRRGRRQNDVAAYRALRARWLPYAVKHPSYTAEQARDAFLRREGAFIERLGLRIQSGGSLKNVRDRIKADREAKWRVLSGLGRSWLMTNPAEYAYMRAAQHLAHTGKFPWEVGPIRIIRQGEAPEGTEP